MITDPTLRPLDGRRGAQRTPRLARKRAAGSHSERSLARLVGRTMSQTLRRRRKSRGRGGFSGPAPARDFAVAFGVGPNMAARVQVRNAWVVLRPLLSANDGAGSIATGAVRGDALATAAATAAPFSSGLDDLAIDKQLEQLIVLHGEAIYRVALSVVRDAMTAEDVAQEALLKAWQALPSYRGEAPLRSWLLRIAHNTAVSTLRKRREEPLDPVLLPERSRADSTERTVEQRAAMHAFEHALANLDDLSRSIMVLREIEGLAYESIAEVLSVPLPTVKTRLLRARRVLSASLDGWRP